ncbi:adenosine receptor A3-like [Oculina patagonica]
MNQRNMNSTATSQFFEDEPDSKCYGAFLPVWKSGRLSAEVYTVLIFTTIVSLLTLPLTIFLNALVIVAVKSTRRLRTKSNILLACLAATDFMVALTVQPSYIAMAIFFLEGKNVNEVCAFEKISRVLFNVFCAVSLFHLVLISLERCLAVKHPFYHDSHITATRLIIASGITWILALFPGIMDFLEIHFEFLMVLFEHVIIPCTVPIIVICQIVVYIEVRRHEKQIASQQVSLEVRQKFVKEKKALKTTTIIIITVFLWYFPAISISYFIEAMVVNVTYIVFFLAVALTLLNSLMNPLIYAARNRQFRVAFVHLLFRRRLEQAEEVEMRVFRSNTVLRTQGGPEELRVS